MKKMLVIMLLVLVVVVGGLALGVAWTPKTGEANCHGFQTLPPIDPDRGAPWNPLRCKPDGLGGMKCSYLY